MWGMCININGDGVYKLEISQKYGVTQLHVYISLHDDILKFQFE